MSAVDLPLGYTSGQAATKIVNMVYNQYKPKEFKDVQVMYLHAHGPGIVHTKGKPIKTRPLMAEPVRSVVRRNRRVRISQRITLAHWLIRIGRSR